MATIQQVRYDIPKYDPSALGMLAEIVGSAGTGYLNAMNQERENMMSLIPVLAQMKMLDVGGKPGDPGTFTVGGTTFTMKNRGQDLESLQAKKLAQELGMDEYTDAALIDQARAVAANDPGYKTDAETYGADSPEAMNSYNAVVRRELLTRKALRAGMDPGVGKFFTEKEYEQSSQAIKDSVVEVSRSNGVVQVRPKTAEEIKAGKSGSTQKTSYTPRESVTQYVSGVSPGAYTPPLPKAQGIAQLIGQGISQIPKELGAGLELADVLAGAPYAGLANIAGGIKSGVTGRPVESVPWNIGASNILNPMSALRFYGDMIRK